nr:MAG TPA: hypothetical protein [Caudoviricetes sp.]
MNPIILNSINCQYSCNEQNPRFPRRNMWVFIFLHLSSSFLFPLTHAYYGDILVLSNMCFYFRSSSIETPICLATFCRESILGLEDFQPVIVPFPNPHSFSKR